MNQTFSKKLNNDEKALILKYMKSHLKDNTSKDITYFFKTKNYSMTIYQNNTLLIQGSNYDNILKMLKVLPLTLKEDQKIKRINIGSDESGNGDLFGGIAIAAVKIPKENWTKIQELGVKDSKLLTDQYMKNIYDEILKLTEHAIININPLQYNELFNKYQNINTIKTYGHNLAIKEIAKKNDCALIDQYTNLNKFKSHLQILQEKPWYDFKLETKAESKYLEVACASILARINFLKQIETISKELNMFIPLGANPKNVNEPLAIIKKQKLNLSKYLKEHFKNNQE
ncbi:MAG: ribonuclease HIII [Mycoplasmoidaceae bacterium]